MTVKRMDNVGIVVEDIDAAVVFFTELGLILEGRMPIEGECGNRGQTTIIPDSPALKSWSVPDFPLITVTVITGLRLWRALRLSGISTELGP